MGHAGQLPWKNGNMAGVLFTDPVRNRLKPPESDSSPAARPTHVFDHGAAYTGSWVVQQRQGYGVQAQKRSIHHDQSL